MINEIKLLSGIMHNIGMKQFEITEKQKYIDRELRDKKELSREDITIWSWYFCLSPESYNLFIKLKNKKYITRYSSAKELKIEMKKELELIPDYSCIRKDGTTNFKNLSIFSALIRNINKRIKNVISMQELLDNAFDTNEKFTSKTLKKETGQNIESFKRLNLLKKVGETSKGAHIYIKSYKSEEEIVDILYQELELIPKLVTF